MNTKPSLLWTTEDGTKVYMSQVPMYSADEKKVYLSPEQIVKVMQQHDKEGVIVKYGN